MCLFLNGFARSCGGNGVVPAVAAGFNKAFRPLSTRHVTTVVSCAFLFMSHGPVKGFAVTLVIGLLQCLHGGGRSRAMFDWHITARVR